MAFDPVWEDTLSYAGQELRRADLMTVMGNGSALGARSGVRPGDPGLTTTLSGSTISVSAGVAVIYQSGQGVYRTAMASGWTGTLTAADATYTRIDLVYLRVWDDDVDASGLRQADPVYLAGTASATPVAPTPAGTQIYVPLATITVPPSGGGAASVSTAVRPYTVGPGGILPSTTAPSSPYTGQAYHNGTDLLIWNGSAWDTYVKTPGPWTTYTPVWTASTTNPVINNGSILGRYSKVGRKVSLKINLIPGSLTTFGSGNYFLSLPFAAASSGITTTGDAQYLASGTGSTGNRFGGQCIISSGASTLSAFFPPSATNVVLSFQTPTQPENFHSGDQVRISVEYESAT
ncbi:hypothetical protein ACWD25_32035 [Streptomyces sp. NPDC002920]